MRRRGNALSVFNGLFKGARFTGWQGKAFRVVRQICEGSFHLLRVIAALLLPPPLSSFLLCDALANFLFQFVSVSLYFTESATYVCFPAFRLLMCFAGVYLPTVTSSPWVSSRVFISLKENLLCKLNRL